MRGRDVGGVGRKGREGDREGSWRGRFENGGEVVVTCWRASDFGRVGVEDREGLRDEGRDVEDFEARWSSEEGEGSADERGGGKMWRGEDYCERLEGD